MIMISSRCRRNLKRAVVLKSARQNTRVRAALTLVRDTTSTCTLQASLCYKHMVAAYSVFVALSFLKLPGMRYLETIITNNRLSTKKRKIMGSNHLPANSEHK